ncbi:MAG TPA: VWA domain-containing protein [Proteobacteria bacterium]|nr:VWA domain-containing protein [Pseudomonadota bacterium]
MKLINGIVGTVTMVVVLFTATAGICHAAKRVRPFNRIVIMLDSSGSFKARQMEALDRAVSLIDNISAVKVKRWEGQDEVIIISLDSMPEVLWEGTKKDLTSENVDYWKQRFEARKDYQGCTDVEKGLVLAADVLHREPLPEYMYCFVFSDLINEPPIGSIKKCAPVNLPSVPTKDFPWETFADVNVEVLWMPIDQKFAWENAVRAAGLTSFRLHSESESAMVRIDAPKKARHVMNEEEMEAAKAKMIGFFHGIGTFALYVFGTGIAIAGILGAVIIFMRHKNKNNPTRR